MIRIESGLLASLICLGGLALAPTPAQPCGAEWSAPGDVEGWDAYTSYISTTAVWDDGAGPALYIGGEFLNVGGVPALSIARLRDGEWSSVGGGVGGTLRVLLPWDDDAGRALYVGGSFDQLGGGVKTHGVGRWDGTAWSAIGPGLLGSVAALAVFDDPGGPGGPTLYAGGYFVMGGYQRYAARWTGSEWKQVGSLNGTVLALHAWDDGSGPTLFAGGNFKKIGNTPVKGLARWDGSSWTPADQGADGGARSFGVFDDGSGPALYACGSFAGARLGRWDGESWAPVIEPGGAQLWIMTPHDEGSGPALYLGGMRLLGDEAPYPKRAEVYRLKDGGLELVGASEVANATRIIHALQFYDQGAGPELYAGGSFTQMDGVPAYRLAKYGCASGECAADLDGSGSLDLFDYLAFVNGFNAGDPLADCNASGDLTLIDFFCYADRFNQGCP